MARTKPADERRSDLLDAAEALFVAKGVAPTTLEEITSGAGVSKGLFYQYFHTKDDLVFALQQRFVSESAERVRIAVHAKSGWSRKLDACVRACFDSFQSQHELHEVLFRHAGHPSDAPDHPAAHQLLVDTIRSLIADGNAAGAFHIDDLDATALLFFSVMHAFDPTFRGVGDLSDTRLIRATQQLLRRTVGMTEDA